MNYFKVLGLDKSFVVDFVKLEKSYLEKQSLFHPDKFLTKDEPERIKALENTILVNKAYNSLKSDISRALHLLELEGLEIDLEENIIDIPEVLSEIFEERESLESANSIDDLKILKENALRDLENYKNHFNTSYNKKLLDDAVVAFKKMIYKKKFLESIQSKINSIGKLKCS
ncbi:MAG: Fe-S protein assembly co-chaperone HscB [Alphaproteobacteria bacterium]|nr:Fe-S protein assembly co-chaperone HscB [Alphaproteobacteria bacterium]